jgi:hypothetical protein
MVIGSWIDEAGEGQTADYSELASRCISEIKEADVVILYCEPGDQLKGALIEVGAALALGKRVACVGECESLSRVFNAHPLWTFYPSIQAAFEGSVAPTDTQKPNPVTSRSNAESGYCCWKDNGDGGWGTDCNDIWIFETGTPNDNGAKFCIFCGRPLIQVDPGYTVYPCGCVAGPGEVPDYCPEHRPG